MAREPSMYDNLVWFRQKKSHFLKILIVKPSIKNFGFLFQISLWGQSYKTFYTLGQIYKHTLKHVNNAMRQTFVRHNVRTLHPNIFIGLHFSFSLNRQFRHFILHHSEV